MAPTTYAIGDIHGRLDLLDQLLTLIEADAARRGTPAKIVFTGDYMDRGPDSFGVVERVMAGPRRAGDSFVPIRGNHDDLFVHAVTDGREVPDWAWQLFWHTIRSYGTDRDGAWRTDPGLHRHAAFLASLPLFHDNGRYLFVHAGIRPGIAIEDQLQHDLIWIREEFLHHDGLLPRRVVHGHTIMGDKPEMRPHRISIDTGAYRSGILTAAVLDGLDVTFLQAVGEPDRPALVREALLVATIEGRSVSATMQRAFDGFVARDFDLVELERRLRLER
ncbi:metallophosphoesterase family protein [Lichenihabitans sp. Uapishka_5]|uniref:metallophosphoesterase family protein n=1 Tax=Lichenihabitans sp. Uapishka_5 TaxID=3037302 RepID=UPI0029E81770|nr:metallophosphoesterase family protein [Lichenihabitans sp. Uapishka_5]MDX7950178.1 metallophosphoesterase family protein [Lichenihabitans sp. Uapishka_5]